MQQLANILSATIASLGMNKKYKSNLIIYRWSDIVGKDIALQSVPIAVEYGVLFLAVKNSVWSHHLSMMQDEIIHKVNNFVQEALIREVKFKNHLYHANTKKADTDPVKRSLAESLKKVVLQPTEVEKTVNECQAISDPKLRKKVLNLYQKNIKFNKYKQQQGWHPCRSCQTLCDSAEEYCQVCSLINRQAKLLAIQRELSNVPWATYADIHKYIECSAAEYIDAKVSLLQRLAALLGDRDEASMEAKILTMLFTGAGYEALTPKMIKRTVNKFRRNNYVSSSRV